MLMLILPVICLRRLTSHLRQTTVVDFTVTQKGLEEQLLGGVIQKEQKSLEEQLKNVLEEVSALKQVSACAPLRRACDTHRTLSKTNTGARKKSPNTYRQRQGRSGLAFRFTKRPDVLN